MLIVQNLLVLQNKPEVDEISLQTIAEFYHKYLCGMQYFFELRHSQRELRLRFKPGDLCHLLGIHYVLKGSENVGEKGFEKLMVGTNTFKTLREANLGEYEDKLYRMLYFPFVYQLVRNPTIVANDPHDQSLVRAQFSFVNGHDKHFVELKLRRENITNPNFYVPVSFAESSRIKNRVPITIQQKAILGYDDGYVHGSRA
ncbi:hypothetical protein J4772_35685 [Cohnella sp. LGH]|uniref:PBECR4 domain-containing protein n=1 Tax=Cohnella sp. LGH TaxID=1619153 RepID=UPI001ADAF0EF|nr:PBECR4 domain-containing protein [Cohnella sp. LGH]QTH42736.1 hypothetical protein J4772_35685 [Cohnella sp. LGH]